jgi:hypothetical protein
VSHAPFVIFVLFRDAHASRATSTSDFACSGPHHCPHRAPTNGKRDKTFVTVMDGLLISVAIPVYTVLSYPVSCPLLRRPWSMHAALMAHALYDHGVPVAAAFYVAIRTSHASG